MIVKQGNRYLIDGPITLDNIGALIAEGTGFEGKGVIVDFAAVTRADSSVLSLLLEWTRQYRGSGRTIVFSNLSHDLRSLADLYGVVDLIPVAAD